MDSIDVEKIQALKKYKQQQFVSSLLFYPLAALICGLIFTSPFWFPSLYSSTKTFLCVSIPTILSLFFNAKSLFIVGNLIVIFLVGESKVRTDPSWLRKIECVVGHVKEKKISQERLSAVVDMTEETVADVVADEESVAVSEVADEEAVVEEEVEEVVLCKGEEEREDGGEREGMALSALQTDELRRRADSFIAMVNKQIRLEADEVLFSMS